MLFEKWELPHHRTTSLATLGAEAYAYKVMTKSVCASKFIIYTQYAYLQHIYQM